MSRVLSILFNTDMVRAILDGRKTVTRRVVKFPVNKYTHKVPKAENVTVYKNTICSETVCFHEEPFYCFDIKPPYHCGDILYVRETWSFIPCVECAASSCDKIPFFCENKEKLGCYIYRTGFPEYADAECVTWHPSIHMPKEAARIWLKVMDVRAERLQNMWASDTSKEGLLFTRPYTDAEMLVEFSKLWDSTIPKSKINLYGWNADPWVWVIDFERREKPEEL